LRLNLAVKLRIHKVFHMSLREPFRQQTRKIDLETVLDAADLMGTDDGYNMEEGIASLVK
jgi:hypothetical protein